MKVVDLFCGCGGLSLGFKKAGFDIVAAFDVWEAALKVYRDNFNVPTQRVDLNNSKEYTRIISALNPDVIIGGPSFPRFSLADHKNADEDRRNQAIFFAHIVCNVRPIWVVMESASRIINTPVFIKMKELLIKAGYGLSYRILDASYCGVPQKRKQLFLIGKLNEKDFFIDKYISNGISSRPMTIRDYLGESLGIEYYYRHPRSYNSRGIFSIDEPSPTIGCVNRPMPYDYKLHPNDPVNSKKGVRSLTTLERSYIQTFPKSFHFVGSKTDLDRMIGYATPVNLGTFVAKAIQKYQDGSHKNEARTPNEAGIFFIEVPQQDLTYEKFLEIYNQDKARTKGENESFLIEKSKYFKDFKTSKRYNKLETKVKVEKTKNTDENVIVDEIPKIDERSNDVLNKDKEAPSNNASIDANKPLKPEDVFNVSLPDPNIKQKVLSFIMDSIRGKDDNINIMRPIVAAVRSTAISKPKYDKYNQLAEAPKVSKSTFNRYLSGSNSSFNDDNVFEFLVKEFQKIISQE